MHLYAPLEIAWVPLTVITTIIYIAYGLPALAKEKGMGEC